MESRVETGLDMKAADKTGRKMLEEKRVGGRTEGGRRNSRSETNRT